MPLKIIKCYVDFKLWNPFVLLIVNTALKILKVYQPAGD